MAINGAHKNCVSNLMKRRNLVKDEVLRVSQNELKTSVSTKVTLPAFLFEIFGQKSLKLR